MITGVKDYTEEKAELDFYVLKRAVGDVMNGKHEPLFKKPQKVMKKEENYNKFDEFLKSFEKNKGGV